MNKHGHAAKGSNALVASVDFYSSALADALAENERLQSQLAAVGAQMRTDSDALKLAAPVLRSAMLWNKAYMTREVPGPSLQEYDDHCNRLSQDVDKYVRQIDRMEDRSSMEDDDA